jgi:hypothetical protein
MLSNSVPEYADVHLDAVGFQEFDGECPSAQSLFLYLWLLLCLFILIGFFLCRNQDLELLNWFL